jgi:hypothetical protein
LQRIPNGFFGAAMYRQVILAVALIALAAGCANTSKRRTIREYTAGGDTTTTDVKYDATYTLHAVDQPETLSPVMTADLKQGSNVGFRSDGNGIVAVAGHKAVSLPPGNYVWRVTPETELGALDRFRTGVRGKVRAAASALAIPISSVMVPFIIIHGVITDEWP